MGFRERVRRRALLRLAGGVAVTGIAGCTEQFSSGGSEPEEPPAGIESDGVDLEQLLANVEAVLREGEYEFAGWANEREGGESSDGSGSELERSGRAAAVDTGAEEGLHAIVWSHDEPLGTGLVDVADVFEYYDGDDGYRKRSDEDPEQWRPFQYLYDQVVDQYFAEVSEIAADLEYGEPTWDGDVGAYVVPVEESAEAAEEYDVTIDGELHVDRDGIAVWAGGRVVEGEEEHDVGIEFTPGGARIEEPDWVEEVSR